MFSVQTFLRYGPAVTPQAGCSDCRCRIMIFFSYKKVVTLLDILDVDCCTYISGRNFRIMLFSKLFRYLTLTKPAVLKILQQKGIIYPEEQCSHSILNSDIVCGMWYAFKRVLTDCCVSFILDSPRKPMSSEHKVRSREVLTAYSL
jgi:hypothetical protein